MSSTLVLDRRLGSLTFARNAATIAWLGVLGLAVSLVPGSLVVSSVATRPVPAIGPEAVSIYGLPLPAQAVISKTLGKGDRAYHVRGLHATNPAQRIEATFAATGVSVHANGHRLGLAFRGPAVEPIITANRVEYRRGAVTEWYVNGPLGLEQGFTVARPTGGTGLALELAVSGTLSARVAGRSVVFSADGDRLLRLRGLFAFDADLRPLRARFVLNGRTLGIRVDDAGARYPVTVDPFVERAKLRASDGLVNEELGRAVAIDGNVIVAGARLDGFRGSAYVFVAPLGNWAGVTTESARLVASDANVGGDGTRQLGSAVDIDGDTIVAGDPLHGTTDLGAVYVYVKPPGGWSGTLTESARLHASDGAPNDRLGEPVAVDGDTVAVGVALDDHVSTSEGSAYVFVRPGAGWAGTQTESAKLIASDGAFIDRLGASIDIAADTVVAGAVGDDVATNSNQGSAYVFVEPPLGWAGTLVESARLFASDGAPNDLFGSSAAIDGSTIVLGAPLDDGDAPNDNRGSAYVFVEPPAGWAGPVFHSAKLIPTDSTGGGNDFGLSLAIAGSTVVVGRYLDGPPSGSGSAYVFSEPGSGWSGTVGQSQKLTASDGEESDSFGFAVAISDGTIVAGALGHDSFRGAAYVFGPLCIRDGVTVIIDLPAGQSVTVSRSGNAIHANGEPCQDATVTNVDVISVNGVAAGNESLTVDLSGGAFAPGVETASETGGAEEIEWTTSSVESVTIQGSSGADTIKFGLAGGNLNADNDADLSLPDVATTVVYGGLGNDVLTGGGAFGNDSKWAKPLHLYGQDGMDKLTGGTDDDLLDGGNGKDNIQQFNAADGGDTIVGGAGVDQLSYSTRQAGDPLSVTLDGAANDGSVGEGDNVGVDVENVYLGAGNDFFDATAVLINNVVQGGAGNDELHGGGKADQLRGDGGNDLLFGDGGNDILNALEPEIGTSDTLSGGTGTDTCRTDDADVITDC